MSSKVPRIRHYIGTIVAACTLGGLLLAFELAFLFQSFERTAAQQSQTSAAHTALKVLERDFGQWLARTRDAVGDGAGLKLSEAVLGELLVRLEALAREPEALEAQGEIAELRAEAEDILVGAKMSVRTLPGSSSYEQDCADVRAKIEAELGPSVRAHFQAVGQVLAGDLQFALAELERSRTSLWRTAAILASAYALVVLVLWRWVTARFLRPLQALTRESRRSLSGEAVFHLRPDGPHEVRLLTESVSTLVGNLTQAQADLERKVIERTSELERANRAKNEFLANMSHEIRTPMTAILGYAELCLAPDIPETDRRRYAEIIHDNGEHLLSVINDILDVSKIEAGRMTVEPTLCSPFEVVTEVHALMGLRAREKGLELRVENQGPIPEVVRTDPTRLRQILLNLLNNALKFTDQGRVVLRFQLVQTAEGPARLQFEVEDTGVGLTPAQIERVFRPFVQADTSTTRKYGGSGLGLAISQALARLLGGDLTCESAPGVGSKFRVTLDVGSLEGVRLLEQFPEAARVPRAVLPVLGPGPDLRGRVLLAEDVAVNRRLISTILLRAGIRVDEAENGRVALEKTLAARDAGQPFDIVFMDMQMPEMDGYEATQKLRQSGYLRPIVALTSHSMSGERQRCLDAGCDEYMTKPIDRLVLLQVLSRFLPASEAEEHQAA